MKMTRFSRKNVLTTALVAAILFLTAYGFVIVLSGNRTGTAAAPSESVQSAGAEPPRTAYDPESDNADGFWSKAAPGETGIDAKAVDAYVSLCAATGADAALVVHKGKIVGEWYSKRYPGTLTAMSSTKSVTGLLVGMMRDRGYLSVDDPVGMYLPDWKEGIRGRVTIRHLLTQTGGLSKRSGAGDSVGFVDEKNKFVRALVPDREPGTEWAYSNEGVQLLSPVMAEASGTNLSSFAERELFGPLGMKSTRFRVSGKNGDVWTYADLETSPRDFARLGMLILGNGVFGGSRIVSEAYLEESFSPAVSNPPYGYLWWLSAGSDVAIMSRGYLSTNMTVLPRHELVVVRMQAPLTTFSGKDESAPYDEYEQEFFSMLVGKTNPDKAVKLLKEASAVRGNESAQKILDEAVSLSRNGNEEKVLGLLLPLSLDDSLPRTLKAKVHESLALQYVRLRNFPEAGRHLDLAEKGGIETLGGYWTASHRDLRNTVGMR